MDTAVRNATKELTSYALDLDIKTVPVEVVQQSKVVLFDTVAILVAASVRPAMRIALRTFPATGGACTIVGHGAGAAPEIAAFINGIGGHDTELDDSHSPSRTHAAAVIVPTALAAAELNQKCTGAQLLAALIAAYDVQARVSKAMGVQSQFDRGFHPSAVCGAIGAAVCAGRILNLTPAALQFAIGLAASQSSGLMTFEDDESHMLKSFHTGVAARNGMTAALLAAQGYEASPDALSGPHNMLVAFGGSTTNYALLTEELGTRFEICGTSIKRHACCGQTHSSVDTLLRLVKEHAIEWREIERIDVELAHKAVPIVDRNPLWTHNIQYILAVAAQQGHIAMKHFSPEWTGRADLTALAAKVNVQGNDRLQQRFPVKKAAIVVIKTTRGTFSGELDSPIGNPSAPLTPADLHSKFMSLATVVLDETLAATLWDRLAAIEHAPGMDAVTTILGTRPRA